MKVLFTIDSLYNGGTEKSLLDMASRFRTAEPVFCCFYQHRHLLGEFEKAGLRVHFLGLHEAYGFPKAARFLSRVLDQEAPDLVVGHLLRAELVSRAVCHRRGVPVAGSFVNDTYALAAYATQSRLRRAKTDFFRLLNCVSARWCVHFVANSAAIARSNARALGIAEEKVSVVPRGRDERVFHPPHPPRTGPIRTIVNVARMLERKGQRELIQAFARIAPDHADVRLRIAGDGVFRNALQREVERLGMEGRVELLGNVAAVPDLLRDADVFAFPSHFEGFSGALVEAMLTGSPIVASDIPMNLEAVEHGHTARTFAPRDVDALEEQLRWCLGHPEEAREMGGRARTVALARYTLDRVAAQFEDLLLRLGSGSYRTDGETVTDPGAPCAGGAPCPGGAPCA